MTTRAYERVRSCDHHGHAIDNLVDVLVQQAPRPIVEKTIEAPQLQYIDEVVNFLVVQQGQLPMVQTVLDNVEVPKLQVIDNVVGIPSELPRLQFIDTVGDIPVLVQMQIPMVQVA